MKSLHIVLTVNAAWNILNFRLPVVRAFLAQGHRITILAPPDPDSAAKLTDLGCAFVPLSMDVKGLSPARDGKLVLEYRRHFKALRPDVVFSYTIKNNLFGALAAKSMSIPFVPNVTGLGTAFLSGGLLETVAETLYKLCFRNLPLIFIQNRDDRALFLDRGLVREDQVCLLPGSGIDLTAFPAAPYPPDDAPVSFLMIARLIRDKGVVEYAEAARQVKAARPDTQIRLLGPLGAENRGAIDPAIVDGWVQDGIVDYLGATDDVRPFIADASCVVLPSYREGAPRTLIEAAAMARPLIATDVPGCRDVVQDGQTGFLCTVQDANSLAQAMIRFADLSHPARAKLGAAGRRKVETEYDVLIIIREYSACAEEVSKGH